MTLLPALKCGGLYRARVESLLADGRVRLLLGGAHLVARAEAGVVEGEELVVEVIRLVPEVRLRIHRPAKVSS